MSDINAAPSSTEPSNEAAKTDMQEVGTATAGESVMAAAQSSLPAAPADVAASAQAASSPLPFGDVSATDAPAVAASGEGLDAPADMATANSTATDVNVSAPSDGSTGATESGDDPNAGASPAAGQSASDTASSAQDASLGGDTAADALRAEIASLQQQLTDTHAEVAKWQGLYNAATAAKPHAQSLLQKLEAGEAIVMGDLQSRLRSFVDAL